MRSTGRTCASLCVCVFIANVGEIWGLDTALKRVYTVGAWTPGNADTVLSKWKPIFETYLTKTVGSLYNPTIEFKLTAVDYDNETSSPILIDAGRLDFVYSEPGSLACLETEYQFAPIATQRQSTLGQQTGGIGSVIYSLASNDKIKNITDLADKRIGVGQSLSVGTFQLGVELLLEKGIDVWKDVAQITFYQSDYKRQMEDVLAGTIDAAVVLSGWFEANHPDQMSNFRFHNVQEVDFQAEAYPFVTSTYLAPQFGLSASPDITWKMRQQIMKALGALKATDPACIAAGIAGFTMPASYEPARSLAEDIGVMVTVPEGRHCHSRFDSAYAFVICPEKYVKDSQESAFSACDDAQLPCADDLHCLCRPCVLEKPENVFPWQLVLGLCCLQFAVSLCFALTWRSGCEDQEMHGSHYPNLAIHGGWKSGGKHLV